MMVSVHSLDVAKCLKAFKMAEIELHDESQEDFEMDDEGDRK